MIVNRIHQNQCHLRPMNVSVFWQLWWMCDKRWHFHLRYLSTEWMRSKPCRRWTHSLTIHIQISYTVRRFIERTKHQLNTAARNNLFHQPSVDWMNAFKHTCCQWLHQNPLFVAVRPSCNCTIKIVNSRCIGSNALHRQHPCYAFISPPFLSLAFQTLHDLINWQ